MRTQHSTVLEAIRNMIEEAAAAAHEDELELFRGMVDGSEAHLDTLEVKKGVTDPWLVLTLTDGTVFKIIIEKVR